MHVPGHVLAPGHESCSPPGFAPPPSVTENNQWTTSPACTVQAAKHGSSQTLRLLLLSSITATLLRSTCGAAMAPGLWAVITSLRGMHDASTVRLARQRPRTITFPISSQSPTRLCKHERARARRALLLLLRLLFGRSRYQGAVSQGTGASV